MKTKKKRIWLGILLLSLLFMIGMNVKTYAKTGEISYKATYKDATSYDIEIEGLEANEEYDYKAMVCQEQDVKPSSFEAIFRKIIWDKI